MQNKEEIFKIGDVVCLKSDEFEKMTVVKEWENSVKTMRFSRDGLLLVDVFPKQSLKKC